MSRTLTPTMLTATRRMAARCTGRWLVAGLALATTTACGYSLAGRGSFLPDYIETIGIPTFENNTSVFEVEQLLTQEVRSAFIGRGSYRVQPNVTGVDAILTGTISNINITPASFNADQQASRYVFTLTANIEFLDLSTNEVVWSNPQLGRDVLDAHVGNEARHIVALVRPDRAARGGAGLQQQHRRVAFGGPRRVGRADVGDKPLSIVQQHVAEIRQLGFLACALPIQHRLGVQRRI